MGRSPIVKRKRAFTMKKLGWVGLSSLIFLMGCTRTITTTTTTEEWVEESSSTSPKAPRKTFAAEAEDEKHEAPFAPGVINDEEARSLFRTLDEADPVARNAAACAVTTSASSCVRCCGLVSANQSQTDECVSRARCAEKITPTDNDCRSVGCADAGEGAVCLRCWSGWTCMPVGATC
jgi:hypothetical protein